MRKKVLGPSCFFLATALLVCLVSLPAVAEPAFVFEEGLKFFFPLRGGPADVISFLVFSKEGEISEVSVRVRDIKGPDGQVHDSSAASATLPSNKVTEDGSTVSLKVKPDLFRLPGDYKIMVTFRGVGPDRKPIRGMATVVVAHATAEINVDDLKEQTFELERTTPWSTADQTFRLSLQEISGKSDIANLEVSELGIFVKDTKIRAPGKITFTTSPQKAQPTHGESDAASGGTSAPHAGQDVPVSSTPHNVRVVDLDVRFEGLTKTGLFETTLVVSAPGLGGRKLIRLRLNVTDRILWPLIVIAVGVLGGFVTNYISGKWRPRQINRSQIIRLKGDVGHYRQLVKGGEKGNTIEGLWSRLRSAEESNELGDSATVKTQLEQIEKDLDEFRKAEAKAKSDAQKSLNDLKAQADVYQQQFSPLEPDEERSLHAIRDRFSDVDRLLRQGQVDYAQEKLAAVTALCTDLKKRRLTNYLESLVEQFEKLKAQTEPADQAECEKLIGEARVCLNEAKLEEARIKLDELKRAIVVLSTKKKARGAREVPPLTLEDVPQVPAAPERTRINVGTSPEARTTDRNIEFEIVDPEGKLQKGDVIRWTFGEPGSQAEDGKSITYRYREHGDYNVGAEVIRAGQPVPDLSLTEPVMILPGQAVRAAQGIRESIKAADLILSIIALLLASVTGLLFLYVGKPFGSISDYFLALLWGFGIDNTTRGFASVMAKISSGGGAA